MDKFMNFTPISIQDIIPEATKIDFSYPSNDVFSDTYIPDSVERPDLTPQFTTPFLQGLTLGDGHDPFSTKSASKKDKTPVTVVQESPTPTLTQPLQAEGVQESVMGFVNLAKKHGINFKISSGFRKGAKTKSGKPSFHATGMAVDLVPGKGETWDSIRHKMKGNEILEKYLMDNKLGILDETTKEMLAKTGGTGAHWHIGPDQIALKGLAKIIRGRQGAKLLKIDNESILRVRKHLQGGKILKAQTGAQVRHRTVQKGENLSKISQELNIPMKDVQFMNNIGNANNIKVGQKIKFERPLPEKTFGDSGWNPKNWGNKTYKYDEFGDAYAAAKQDGQSRFYWNDRAYKVNDAQPTETQIQETPTEYLLEEAHRKRIDSNQKFISNFNNIFNTVGNSYGIKFTPEQKAAVLSSMDVESGLRWDQKQFGGGPGRGLLQFEEGYMFNNTTKKREPKRHNLYKDYLKRNNLTDSENNQLTYLAHMIMNDPTKNRRVLGHTNALGNEWRSTNNWNAWQSSTPENMARTFSETFVRPGKPHIERRINTSAYILGKYRNLLE